MKGPGTVPPAGPFAFGVDQRMGSWNGTCAVTNLPICYQDPVRLVLLVETKFDERRSAGGFCYSTGLWYPLGAPLRGIYDTYGTIVESFRRGKTAFNTGVNEDIIRKEIFPYILPYEKDEGREIKVSPESDWKEFLFAVERGAVRIKRMGREHRIGQALIHEDVYQAMLQYTWENWLTQQPMNAEVYRAAGRDYLKRVAAGHEVDKKDPEGALLRAMRRTIGEDHEPLFESAMRGEEGRGASMLFYDFAIRTGVREGTVSVEDPAIISMIDDLCDLMAVRAVMSMSRKFWSPQSGAGSQDENLDVHTYLADVVKAHVTEAKRKSDEE